MISGSRRRTFKPAIESLGLTCERADDIYGTQGLMQGIWERINQSRVIVAEMTGRNPNVLYELGIAHTLGKPVVMVTQSIDYVPSDLRHLRCIIYDYKPHSIGPFRDAFVRTLSTAVDSSRG